MSSRIEVSNWTPSPPTRTTGTRGVRGNQFKPPSTTVGLIGTALVHCLVLQAVLTGSAAHRMPPSHLPRTNPKSGTNSSETLILLDLPVRSQKANQSLKNWESWGQAPSNFPVTISPPSRVAIAEERAGDNQGESAASDTGNTSNGARLLGIYSGQIHDRIERGWRRPRTPVDELTERSVRDQSEDLFICQVRIVQDATGNIQEVLLTSCNGSAAWKQSLVAAVKQSSPLPAPPDPSVFSRTVVLQFTARSYGPGANEDDYEMAKMPALRVASDLSQ
jgi:hypothetical protein